MDEQDYNNQNKINEDLLDKQEPENYPSENEILSSQDNNNNNPENTPQQDYCPPPVPLELNQQNQTDNGQQNSEPQAPYLKYGPIYNPNYLNAEVPPPIPIGDDISYQTPDNQNTASIPVQQQIVVQNEDIKEDEILNQIQVEKRKKDCCCCNCEDCCYGCCDCCSSCCECFCNCFCDFIGDCMGELCTCENFGVCLLYIFCCCIMGLLGGN